jgi:hypothetical protein
MRPPDSRPKERVRSGTMLAIAILAAEGFQWGLAVSWLISIALGALNLWQWLRGRKLLVWTKMTSERSPLKNEPHKRFLYVDVRSLGADIYDLFVLLEWKIEGIPQKWNLCVIGDVPNPLKLLQSRRFYIPNDDPRTSHGTEELPLYDVAIVIMSGVVEVERIQGRRFRKLFDAFASPDASLPPKPPLDPDRPWRGPPPNKW